MSDSGSIFNALNHSVQDPQSDAVQSSSERSENSLITPYDRSRSRGRPRKRKITESLTFSQPRLKRLKTSYNDDYRALFNSTVKEIASIQSPETDTLLQESQFGVTIWSSEEKEAFFHALAKRGRQDIRGTANDIGSKSESEVYVYSDVLYRAAADHQRHESRKNLLDTSILEAALEVSGDCCTALDLAAEALSALQQNDEERVEKKRYKDLALLTPRVAKWVESCLVAPEGGKEEVSKQIPAARLLNLKNFLTLSKRFFMNSVTAEDNWRSYTGHNTKSPSIMYTAFSDFHALSLSITLRLVQSCLFFAMSRLRATSSSGYYTPRSYVRRRDVVAALNVLGMKTDAKAFWAKAARKCKLRVYDKVRRRQVFGKRYSYVEVERILSPSMISDPDSPEILAKDAYTSTSRKGRTLTESSSSASEGSVRSESMSIEAESSSALSNAEDLSATLLEPTNKHNHKQEGDDQLQDAYAEALDQQASRNEERRLWEMLGQNRAEGIELEDVKLRKGPYPKWKQKEELDDWRYWVDYAEDWEVHETPVCGSSFANNRMDVDSATGLTSSQSSLESLISNGSTEEEHSSDPDEDADSDGESMVDGSSTSPADAEHGARNNGGDSDRDLGRTSLDHHSRAINEQRGGLRSGEDDARRITSLANTTNNDMEGSDDDSSNE